MSIVLPLSIRPIATAAVAATGKVTETGTRLSARKIAVEIAWQVATNIAVAALSTMRTPVCRAVAPVSYPAKVDTMAQNSEAGEYPIPSNGPEP